MDRIFQSWLVENLRFAAQLADASDRLDLEGVDEQRFIAHYHCAGLVRDGTGAIDVAQEFSVGFSLPNTYLEHLDPLRVLTWLGPADMWHPNRAGATCCIGDILPGTSIVDLLHRTYLLITYQEVMPDERNALNLAACAWARNHSGGFPIDDRPLKRRASDAAGRG